MAIHLSPVNTNQWISLERIIHVYHNRRHKTRSAALYIIVHFLPALRLTGARRTLKDMQKYTILKNRYGTVDAVSIKKISMAIPQTRAGTKWFSIFATNIPQTWKRAYLAKSRLAQTKIGICLLRNLVSYII